jgi:peptidyl-prolyl cis-trans isomerase C
MHRNALIALCLLAATVASAQTAAPVVDDSKKPVATINGETITKAKLDQMYTNMNGQMRAQYEGSGGKAAFLENYIAKRLLIQEAMKTGFDQKPETVAAIEMAKESALFDRFVRDVVGGSLVTDGDVRKYYEDNKANFVIPEQVKVRHIIITPQGKTKEEARQRITQIMTELRAGISGGMSLTPEAQRIFLSRFGDAARKYSEDGVAQDGGDLGWQARGKLDAKFEEAAFNMPVGRMSGIIETQFGYHLILVEDKKAPQPQPYDLVKNDIREYLLSQRAADVMGTVKRMTNELRAQSKVAVYPENIR